MGDIMDFAHPTHGGLLNTLFIGLLFTVRYQLILCKKKLIINIYFLILFQIPLSFVSMSAFCMSSFDEVFDDFRIGIKRAWGLEL